MVIGISKENANGLKSSNGGIGLTIVESATNPWVVLVINNNIYIIELTTT